MKHVGEILCFLGFHSWKYTEQLAEDSHFTDGMFRYSSYYQLGTCQRCGRKKWFYAGARK